jgi:hypothetical protein
MLAVVRSARRRCFGHWRWLHIWKPTPSALMALVLRPKRQRPRQSFAIRKGDLKDGFSASIHRCQWSHLADRGQVQAGLDLLCDLHWITTVEKETSPEKRRAPDDRLSHQPEGVPVTTDQKYLERLKAEISKKRSGDELTKLTKGGFCQFCQYQREALFPLRSTLTGRHAAHARLAGGENFGAGLISIKTTIRAAGCASSARRRLLTAGRVISAGCLRDC